MANKKKPIPPPEPKVRVLAIKRGRDVHHIQAWRYYSIIDLLRDMGVERLDAEDAAKWAGRVPVGIVRQIGEIKLEVKE